MKDRRNKEIINSSLVSLIAAEKFTSFPKGPDRRTDRQTDGQTFLIIE